MVVAFMLSTNGIVVQAAPVTFQFKAEVTSIVESSSANIELPWTISVGDPIQGRFTFEPAPIGQMGTQEFGIQFAFGDAILQSSTYEIIIARNQFPPLGSTTFEPFDMITVGCSLSQNGAPCIPGYVQGAGQIQWRSFISLTAEPPTLSDSELIGDVDIWNSFNGRSLQLNFLTPGVGGVSIGALFGPFSIVPEPETLITGLLGTFGLVCVRARFCRHD